jgi:NAD-dependent deacetylase
VTRGEDDAAVARAASILRSSRRVLVFTGAGISTESGIPDFRGPDGLWTKVDPDDFTIQRYLSDPELRARGWRMNQHGELWGARSTVRPNPAHYAVTRLWEAGRSVGVVTQNVDGLHQASGLPDHAVAEVHGNVRKTHCIHCDALWPTEEVLGWVDRGDADPHCPRCGGVVKTTTVMFGEVLPHLQVERAMGFAAAADGVLAVGTTMSVYPAADFALSPLSRGAPLVIVNLGPTEHDRRAAARVELAAGTAMPALVDALTTGG